jgi:hypothetical protein
MAKRAKQIADLIAFYPESVRMPARQDKEEIKVPLKLSVSATPLYVRM